VDVAGIAEDRVVAALAALQGEQQQRPPRYSARHVDGERSYRLARRGIAAELPATPVTVHRIELVSYAPPELAFRVTVSAGTYVRALARDLGARLGVGAHLTALRREAVGALRIEDAVPLERVDASALRPPGAALGHLPTRELDEPGRLAVSHGRALPVEPGASGDVALLHAGRLVAVARADDGWLRPSVVLGTP
jgi:tRNA pseudouridine55 synthase